MENIKPIPLNPEIIDCFIEEYEIQHNHKLTESERLVFGKGVEWGLEYSAGLFKLQLSMMSAGKL